MSSRIHRVLSNWATGLMTAMSKDRLPETAFSVGRNVQLYNIGPDAALVGSRAGAAPVNGTTMAESIVAQNFFEGASADYHFLVGGTTGDLKKLNPSTGVISTVASAPFTVTNKPFSWASAQGLCFVVNGTDAKKTDGTGVYKFGIAAPVSGAWSATAAAGGAMPVDTYDVAITYYNNVTGAQSSRSDTKQATTSAGIQTINVVIPSAGTIADAQVTHVQIHIRRQSTQSLMYQVVAGVNVVPADANDNVAGGIGFAVQAGTRTPTINMSAAQFLAQQTLTPGINAKLPPPTGVKSIAWHKNRMFAATADELFWTEIAEPESFNPLDFAIPVYPDDGDPIVCLHSANDTLLVFKATHTYALVGDDPQTWVLQRVSDTVGTVAPYSVGHVDNKVAFWSIDGPRIWTSGEGIQDITTQFVAPDFTDTSLNLLYRDRITFLANTTEGYIGWALPKAGSTVLTHMAVFNYKLGCWMSTQWDPCDIASICMADDSNNRTWVMLGDPYGTVYKLGSGNTDGIPNTITKVSAPVTSATSNTLSDSTASWPVNGLAGRYVYTYPTASGLKNIQRRRITSNTATQLTLATNWDSLPTTAYTYVLGGILLDWRSPWYDLGDPFMRKRLEFIYLSMEGQGTGTAFDLDVYTDYDEYTSRMFKAVGMSSSGAISTWDSSKWDTAKWTSTGTVDNTRTRVGCVGRVLQVRISSILPNQRVVMHTMGIQAVPRSRKLS